MPVPVLTLDLLQTLTLAAVVYYAGVLLRQRIAVLNRLNIPSAVVGGLRVRRRGLRAAATAS